VTSSDLPSLTFGDARRAGQTPDPLARPGLYHGVLWRRSAAYLVDVLILIFVDLLVHALLIIGGLLTFGLLWALTGVVAFMPLAILYGTLFIGGGEAATPGMRLFDIEVRSWDDRRPDYWQAFLMTALFYATVTLTSFLILAVALFTPQNRAIHDYLSGVVVLRRGR
jgi:uncharacterized RDD family membrane protein YckC